MKNRHVLILLPWIDSIAKSTLMKAIKNRKEKEPLIFISDQPIDQIICIYYIDGLPCDIEVVDKPLSSILERLKEIPSSAIEVEQLI
jgi:hypothetical protein